MTNGGNDCKKATNWKASSLGKLGVCKEVNARLQNYNLSYCQQMSCHGKPKSGYRKTCGNLTV